MYVDLLKYVQDAESRLGWDSASCVNLRQLVDKYPTLRAYRDHLGVIRLCAVDVNSLVDSLDMTHRTEDGGSLEILPFYRSPNGRVYADPPLYIVGRRNPAGFGEIPLADWRELLVDAGIGTEVIRKVGCYLGAHQPVNYDEVPD